jgi:membrane associated rhomboid family serine protease
MLPIKDNLPHERFPVITLALVAANALAYALSAQHLALAPTLLDVVFLGLLGASVEGALGHGRLLAASLAGASLALVARALSGAASPAALPFAAAGATIAVLGSYLVLFPRGRVVTLVLVPFLVTIVEVPAALLLGLWLAAQLYIGVAG